MRFGFPDLLPLFSRPTAHKGLLLPRWTFQLGMGMPGASVNVGLHNTAGCYTNTIAFSMPATFQSIMYGNL